MTSTLPMPMRLLIVDDDEVLLRALSRSFERLGCHVTTVNGGLDALEQLAARPFDAMLLDLHMDGMDGWEVMRRVSELRPRPALVVHSGYLDVQTAVLAIRSGADEVIEKPTDAETLLARVRSILLAAPDRGPSRGPARLLGQTPHVKLIREQIVRVSRFPDLAVLVEGETGTGKELVAQAIHELTRPDAAMVAVNCAAVPAELFESELFGHEAGAFTGAKGPRTGLFEAAGEGTVFLDEIGELPIELQPKLLRVLETRQFRRVGSNRDIPLRARIVSATNRSLASVSGRMRPDLYFRLAGFMIWVPPLRERMPDLELLANHFVLAFSDRYPGSPTALSARALDALRTHDWPGNLRELRSVIEQAVVLGRGNQIAARDVGEAMRDRSTSGAWRAVAPEEIEAHWDARESGTVRRPVGASLRDVERELILSAYATHGRNLSATARDLGIPRSTLRDKLRKYGER